MLKGKSHICRTAAVIFSALFLIVSALGWARYLQLKQALIAGITDSASSAAGHKVVIGDISFSALTGITIHDIAIKNPEGFHKGDLLSIKRLSLSIRYQELFKRRFSFSKIEIDRPEISLLKDRNGALNISEKLKAFFSKKGTISYQVDELLVRRAGASFNSDPLYRIDNANARLTNLSSEGSPKSGIRAYANAFGRSRFELDGWIYLRDETRKFGLTVHSREIDLAPSGRRLMPYDLDPGKSIAEITINSEGDIKNGISIRINSHLTNAGAGFIKKWGRKTDIIADAFFDPAKDMLVLKDFSIAAGRSSSLHMTGSVHNLSHAPHYAAGMKISGLDLSAFNFIRGVKIAGIAASENIRIKGAFSSGLPEISGNLSISRGAISSDTAEIQQINANIGLRLDKELSIHAEAAAGILKASSLIFSRPAGVILTADASGSLQDIRLSSRILLSDAETALEGKTAAVQALDASFAGSIQGKKIIGRTAASIKDLRHGERMLKNIRTGFNLDYDGKALILSRLDLESDYGNMSAETVTFNMSGQRKHLSIAMKNLGMHAAEEAGISGLDCDMGLSMPDQDKDIRGTAVFSAKSIMVQGISTEKISGRASLDSSGFILDLTAADFLNGKLQLSASGRAKDGPFPVSLDIRAEKLDISQAAKALRRNPDMPYAAAGELGIMTFKGKITSSSDITGRASLSAEKVSLINAEKRNIIKDAALLADVILKGKDLDIMAEASAGGLKARISGGVERFYGKDRLVSLGLTVPEVRTADIRTALWEVVPDRLLYAGMDGSVALDLSVAYSGSGMTADGRVLLRDISVEGENNEYSAGPVNGMLPIHYSSTGANNVSFHMPSFDRSDFEELKKNFSGAEQFSGNEIKIGSIRYGFRFMDNISLWAEQQGRALNINRISANMFGGRLYGAAAIELTSGLAYRAGIVAEGISLTNLCDEITPIKGYLSGKIDGVAAVKGSGSGLAKILGKADFWTYGDRSEKTLISREFLEKIGGPQVKAYLGERRFDKGIMGLYIQDGFFIFRELEISNRNFIGMTDLSVKVAPMNNRIAIDHLMWTIATAAQRAKKQ